MSRPPKSRHFFARAARFDPRAIKEAVSEVEGFNAKLALVITRSVGTMLCAYVFSLIALASLPAILVQAEVLHKSDVPNFLTKPGLILIVSWIAQTFIQLVLLSIIMVGQSVQSTASDARAAKEFTDTETILDRLDTHTAGGLQEVLDAIQALGGPARSTPIPPPTPSAG
jgi:hypothetical protein